MADDGKKCKSLHLPNARTEDRSRLGRELAPILEIVGSERFDKLKRYRPMNIDLYLWGPTIPKFLRVKRSTRIIINSIDVYMKESSWSVAGSECG